MYPWQQQVQNGEMSGIVTSLLSRGRRGDRVARIKCLNLDVHLEESSCVTYHLALGADELNAKVIKAEIEAGIASGIDIVKREQYFT